MIGAKGRSFRENTSEFEVVLNVVCLEKATNDGVFKKSSFFHVIDVGRDLLELMKRKV